MVWDDVKVLEETCPGRSDGPGADMPVGVLMVVKGLKVTFRCGRAGGCDVVGELEEEYWGSRGEPSVAAAAIL